MKTLWENDLIQFARLISELESVGAFTNEIMHELRDSMDLSSQQIGELVDRAQIVFEKSKENI